MFWIIWGNFGFSYGPIDRAEAMNWRSHGIKSVLLLTSRKEDAKKYNCLKLFRFKLRVEEVPYSTAFNVEMLKEICTWIHDNIDNFRPVVAVCEEDPTIVSSFLAAYLLFRGASLAAVLTFFHRKRSRKLFPIPIVLPTRDQIGILRRFEEEILWSK
ncbi:MAG: hypothetical protein ACTSVW_03745 [Candidatus Njordarchaeales archaeon]